MLTGQPPFKSSTPSETLAARVVKDQELIWAKGLGYAGLEKEIPVTVDTPLHLASVTKLIAHAALILPSNRATPFAQLAAFG